MYMDTVCSSPVSVLLTSATVVTITRLGVVNVMVAVPTDAKTFVSAVVPVNDVYPDGNKVDVGQEQQGKATRPTPGIYLNNIEPRGAVDILLLGT